MERKNKINLKAILFQVSKSEIHNLQENVSFYNSLTSALEARVNISLKKNSKSDPHV